MHQILLNTIGIGLNMKLFHYTTIETLAHIMNNRSLKFNRLDQLDDSLEATSFADFKPLKYSFTSCFTDDAKENIALWKMYSNMESGIRIEFDTDKMFNPIQTMLPPHNISGTMPDSIFTAIKSNDIVNNDYLLIFWGPKEDNKLGEGIFLRKVIYGNNFPKIYQNKLTTKPSIKYCPWEFGFYKSNYWSFQREVRLLMHVIPNPSSLEEFNNILLDKRELLTTNIFVPLSTQCLENLKLVLAPKVTEASRLIVKALIRDLEGIEIQDSDLYGIIK